MSVFHGPPFSTSTTPIPMPSPTRSSPPRPLRITPKRSRSKFPPLAACDDSSSEYSSHPSIYEASPVGSLSSRHSSKRNTPYGSPGKQKGNANAAVVAEERVSIDSADRERAENRPMTGSLRRNYSSFSVTDLRYLETIKEGSGKRRRSRDVQAEEERQALLELEENAWMADSEDGSDGERDVYYEYASPTLPMHPAVAPLIPPDDTGLQLSSNPLLPTFFMRPAPRTHQHRPTFRPPASSHRSYGTLSAHPFHRAPNASLLDFDANQAPTPDELPSPPPERVENRRGAKRKWEQGVWGEVLRGFCLVCCCIIVSEEEVSGPNPRRW